MSFPLVLRSTYDATVARLEAELRIARADVDACNETIRWQREKSEGDGKRIVELTGNLSEMTARQAEMAQTLLEFANGNAEVVDDEREPEVAAPIPMTPRGRIESIRAKASQGKAKKLAASRQGQSKDSNLG